MSIILRVNDWEVEDLGERIEITNRTHPELNNVYLREQGRYRFRHKRIPKTVDRAIMQAVGVVQPDSDRTFGIEIECYHPTDYDIIAHANNAINSAGISCETRGYTHQITRGWKITTDSSIRGGRGLEVVSPILKGQEGIEEVKKVMKILSDLGCRVNRSTGMHVHIGAKDLSSRRLHKCFDFYKNNESLFDQLVAYSRRSDNNTYCHTLRGLSTFSNSRYVKLNYCSYVKYGTLEFRQHQGSLNGDKAEHWIKLVSSVVNYCNSSKAVKTYSSVEAMVKDLGLVNECSWYLERVEELAS